MRPVLGLRHSNSTGRCKILRSASLELSIQSTREYLDQNRAALFWPADWFLSGLDRECFWRTARSNVCVEDLDGGVSDRPVCVSCERSYKVRAAPALHWNPAASTIRYGSVFAESTLRPSPAELTLRPSPAESTLRPTPAELTLRPTPAESTLRPSPAESTLRPTPAELTLRPSPAESTLRFSPASSTHRLNPAISTLPFSSVANSCWVNAALQACCVHATVAHSCGIHATAYSCCVYATAPSWRRPRHSGVLLHPRCTLVLLRPRHSWVNAALEVCGIHTQTQPVPPSPAASFRSPTGSVTAESRCVLPAAPQPSPTAPCRPPTGSAMPPTAHRYSDVIDVIARPSRSRKPHELARLVGWFKQKSAVLSGISEGRNRAQSNLRHDGEGRNRGRNNLRYNSEGRNRVPKTTYVITAKEGTGAEIRQIVNSEYTKPYPRQCVYPSISN